MRPISVRMARDIDRSSNSLRNARAALAAFSSAIWCCSCPRFGGTRGCGRWCGFAPPVMMPCQKTEYNWLEMLGTNEKLRSHTLALDWMPFHPEVVDCAHDLRAPDMLICSPAKRLQIYATQNCVLFTLDLYSKATHKRTYKHDYITNTTETLVISCLVAMQFNPTYTRMNVCNMPPNTRAHTLGMLWVSNSHLNTSHICMPSKE